MDYFIGLESAFVVIGIDLHNALAGFPPPKRSNLFGRDCVIMPFHKPNTFDVQLVLGFIAAAIFVVTTAFFKATAQKRQPGSAPVRARGVGSDLFRTVFSTTRQSSTSTPT